MSVPIDRDNCRCEGEQCLHVLSHDWSLSPRRAWVFSIFMSAQCFAYVIL